MKHVKYPIRTTDGLRLAAQCWKPTGKIRAVVCLVHGLGEHCGRYLHVADHMTKEGYSLVGFDLRGHGRSEGARVHSPSYDTLFEDISLVLGTVKERFPNVPTFLYGHSFGGQLVLNYCLHHQPEIEGAVVTGPWLRLEKKIDSLKLFTARIMSRLWPSFTMHDVVETAALSRDPEVVHAYENDPLVFNRSSIRFFINAYDAGLDALEYAHGFPAKLLLMHGSSDRITSFDASREFAKSVGKRCTFKEWKNFYHEIHNHKRKYRVLEYMVEWMESILS